ncbi:hypothetical protein SAMD00019534_014740 [Acytostelium subglobosum LB1]|uniref:hypothetical protein n=1 Tax=Acytostelium subglobosum LB1 TaxID=1410327 RepID=UPI000644F2F4|nr:hypothetical protein SAMD00019534_014740 [Acytostelium subglobosum LB1]GAM18299.1 hypothetical protein SAMD00019534_014740 [Acytostelium subglobosum LB1]|eukprot:XP_012757519.1 hypothetical protein SAMD00019534_014740 [Acytostelium subglobosum LB1]
MFTPSKKTIEEGDRVVVYFNRDRMSLVHIKSGQTFNSKFGNFHHKRLIGCDYGSKVASEDGTGFMHILRLTPELWSLTLDHRTQILFNLDISAVIFNLEVRNGSKVVESGTGSGSLSTSFARTIAPLGHLYTFEFHGERAKHAQKDFADNGIDKYITVTHRDVCKLGFQLPEETDMIGHIDAVFLDLPSPWEAIDHAIAVMREGGMLCSFSPCIEQVQAVCLKLDQSDFEEIKTIEVLMRNYDVRVQEDEELFLNNPYKTFESKQQQLQQQGDDNKSQVRKRKKWESGTVESFEVGCIQGEMNNKLMMKPQTMERGHTGYLTFARWMPKI